MEKRTLNITSLKEQVNLLRKLFPGIGYADEKLAEQNLPPNAEGWFAIPRWEKIASTYGEAVQKVLDLIKQAENGDFHDFCEGKFSAKHLRQSKKTRKAFQRLGNEQKDSDILVFSFSFRSDAQSHERQRVRRRGFRNRNHDPDESEKLLVARRFLNIQMFRGQDVAL